MGRKQKLSGSTYQIKTGCGTLYVTINEDENKPWEVFATMGKAGGCAASQIEALGRTISLSLRSGVEAKRIIKHLLGISCHAAMIMGDAKVLSCADAIAQAMKQHLNEREIKEQKHT